MKYVYDPEELGLPEARDPMAEKNWGKAPKTRGYQNYYEYLRGQKKLEAWQNRNNIESEKKKLYNSYLNQRNKTDEQFDRQVRDLRNFASQRNWSRGSATSRQKDRVVGQWGSELNQLDTTYEGNTKDIERQLDHIAKQLKMQLEGIAWAEENPKEDWSNVPE